MINEHLKLLDRQLKNNGMVRVQDTTSRADNSLFRALSMALFFSHGHWPAIKTDLRLTLISNLRDRKSNPYPLLHEPHILKKYNCDPELLLDFWERQQQECFINDNLVLASAAFNSPLCILSIDREDYLIETFIVACRDSKSPKLHLARVGKKFYCVFPRILQQGIRIVRQLIVEELLPRLSEKEVSQKKEMVQVHYPSKDEVVGFMNGKKHKKSLSECNDLSQQLFPEDSNKNDPFPLHKESIFNSHEFTAIPSEPIELPFQEIKNNLQTNQPSPQYNTLGTSEGLKTSFQNGYHESLPLNLQLPLPANESALMNSLESPILHTQQSPYVDSVYYDAGYDMMGAQGYNNFYQYSYQPYMMQQQRYVGEYQTQNYVPVAEQAGPINNQRYTGRLKFFDQSGNYGFLVIDNLNIDLFVHYDDLSKAGLNKEKLLALKSNYELRFQFTYYEYEGKMHKKSKKAVDLILIPE